MEKCGKYFWPIESYLGKFSDNISDIPGSNAVLPATAPSTYTDTPPYGKPLVNGKALRKGIKEQTCDAHLLENWKNKIKIKSVKTRRRNDP